MRTQIGVVKTLYKKEILSVWSGHPRLDNTFNSVVWSGLLFSAGKIYNTNKNFYLVYSYDLMDEKLAVGLIQMIIFTYESLKSFAT